MSIRTYILASSLMSALTLAAAPAAYAQIHGVITVREAPPPMRAEMVPAPRHGYVWAPGYWNWQGRQHVWHRGAWVRARPGYAYAAPSWAERDGRWEFHQGRWARGDSDGDGVPNGVDRRPYDPMRR
jgi:hypothetical protein